MTRATHRSADDRGGRSVSRRAGQGDLDGGHQQAEDRHRRAADRDGMGDGVGGAGVGDRRSDRVVCLLEQGGERQPGEHGQPTGGETEPVSTHEQEPDQSGERHQPDLHQASDEEHRRQIDQADPGHVERGVARAPVVVDRGVVDRAPAARGGDQRGRRSERGDPRVEVGRPVAANAAERGEERRDAEGTRRRSPASTPRSRVSVARNEPVCAWIPASAWASGISASPTISALHPASARPAPPARPPPQRNPKQPSSAPITITPTAIAIATVLFVPKSLTIHDPIGNNGWVASVVMVTTSVTAAAAPAPGSEDRQQEHHPEPEAVRAVIVPSYGSDGALARARTACTRPGPHRWLAGAVDRIVVVAPTPTWRRSWSSHRVRRRWATAP